MGSSGSGSEKLKYIELSRLSILPLAVSSDTITLSHSLGFARPLPADSHSCPNIPSFDLGGNYTRDLGEKNPDSTYRYPLDDLPSGGACNTGQTIRISPGEMVLGILNINQGGTYSVNVKWYNKDNGEILYDNSHTASGIDYSYVWSFIGHFSWEIVSSGNYSCIFTVSGYGSATIDFTVTDSRPPPVVAARPIITSATAYPSAGNETIMFLYRNDGTEGVVKWTGCTYGTYNGQETCWYDANNSVQVRCIQPTAYLYKKGTIPGDPFLDGTESCVYGSRCVIGNDCVNISCAGYEDWITVQYRFPIVSTNVSVPAIVTNLKVSPGNQYFDISWTPADDPLGGGKKVFAYYIQVWKSGSIDPTLTGYWYGDSVGVSIGSLENGVTYEIRVQSISHNNIPSSTYASVTGTPGVTSVIATTGKYHDLVSYGSFAPWTIVEASTFNYGAYPMGDMIDPQWCATAPNESVSDSKSAVAACLVNLTNVYSSGKVTFDWYKGITKIATYYYDIPSPLDYGKSKLDFWSVASWLCKVPGGIDYPGDYAVDVWADPYEFHQYKTITLACGSPVANFMTADTSEVIYSQELYDDRYPINSLTPAVSQRRMINNSTITGLEFCVSKVGSPSGIVKYTVRKVSDDSVIVSVDAYNASILSTASQWKYAKFMSPVTVNEEVRICVEFSGGDNLNYVHAWYKWEGSDIIPSEQMSVKYSTWSDSDTWYSGYHDMAYRVYGSK